MASGQQIFTVIATRGADQVRSEIGKLPDDTADEFSCALLWWLIGGQLGQLRDQLCRSTPAAAQVPSSGTPPPSGAVHP